MTRQVTWVKSRINWVRKAEAEGSQTTCFRSIRTVPAASVDYSLMLGPRVTRIKAEH